MSKAHNTQQDRSALAQVLIRLNEESLNERRVRIKKFESTDHILSYIANASSKDREAFLKPWKNEKAAKGLGRNKKDHRFFFYIFETQKGAMMLNLNKQRLSDVAFLEMFCQKYLPQKNITECRKEFRTICNIISRERTKLKK